MSDAGRYRAMPIQNWKAVLNRFTILFNEHMQRH
jgi:hypothetical protein